LQTWPSSLLCQISLVGGAHPALHSLEDALLLTKPLIHGNFWTTPSMAEFRTFFSCSGVRHLQTLLIEAGSVPGAHPALSALQESEAAFLFTKPLNNGFFSKSFLILSLVESMISRADGRELSPESTLSPADVLLLLFPS